MTAEAGHQRQRALFSGHVQGVGFRYRTCHVAQRYSVAGYVRNLSDGRVELVAEGQASEVDRFLAAVQDEMKDFIDSCDIDRSPATGEFRGFDIRS